MDYAQGRAIERDLTVFTRSAIYINAFMDVISFLRQEERLNTPKGQSGSEQ